MLVWAEEKKGQSIKDYVVFGNHYQEMITSSHAGVEQPHKLL